MQFGILDLVDWYPGTMTQEERYRQVVELGVLAEDLGFDTYWIGEHHFSRYISPHPAILLAAVAARTKRIRIGTSVVLAAHHDPLRLAEDYAMVDVLSGGRLDLVVGRGLFLQGYRGFGIPYETVRARGEEAVEVLRQAWRPGPFSHAGTTRAITEVETQPRPVQDPHPPIWVAGGRSTESIEYAAREGLHLALPQLAGPLDQFRPAVDLYRRRAAEAGHDRGRLRLSVGQHTWVGPTTLEAREAWRSSYPRYLEMVASEMPADLYDGTELEQAARRTRQAAAAPYERVVENAARVGSPAHVAERICETFDVLRMEHWWGALNLGGLPTAEVARAMELLARDVLPVVRRHTSARPA